ncbi:hypothetical protein Ais01nite_50700 [Asanoa ishikariensis]|uniref:Uncharacterized protein n=1 Tax=Asanoa ishikariensis TaxID=137265 RepID=A0A1H3RMW3_9ACTN|nr:hypothetical protein [Asanoa ishikariensis]GIF67035.1 hypothetical protein Ais01nite_50700 [Asanoa ishikariensis]SDZ27026.1 hypothetical protein SAMN05421684_4011 [Asanoa ishikariensis]
MRGRQWRHGGPTAGLALLTRRWLLGLAAAAVAVLAGCGLWLWAVGPPFSKGESDPELEVRNERTAPLTIEVSTDADKRQFVVPAGGDLGIRVNDECGTGEVTARVADRVVARLDDPFCTAKTWIIHANGTAELVGG